MTVTLRGSLPEARPKEVPYLDGGGKIPSSPGTQGPCVMGGAMGAFSVTTMVLSASWLLLVSGIKCTYARI